MAKKREKPAWIVAGAIQSVQKDMSLEEIGFGMTLLACMWRDGVEKISADPIVIMDLVKGQFPSTEKIDAAWIRSRWLGISKLFRELPDGNFEPNPLMFSPPADEPPDRQQH